MSSSVTYRAILILRRAHGLGPACSITEGTASLVAGARIIVRLDILIEHFYT